MSERFTLRLRERFLALIGVGQTIEQASAEVGISAVTVRRWAARGRALDASVDHRSFADRLDATRAEAAEAARREVEEAERPERNLDDPFLALEVAARPEAFPNLSPEEIEHVLKLGAECWGSWQAADDAKAGGWRPDGAGSTPTPT